MEAFLPREGPLSWTDYREVTIRQHLPVLDQSAVPVVLAFDASNWLFALIVFGGGGLTLLMLALAVPSNVRGFGGL